MRAIVSCNCQSVPSRAKAAYQMQFNDDLPEIYSGRNGISSLYEKLDGKSNIGKYIHSLINNGGKFAYYFEWGDDGMVKLQYNLLSGRRII